MIFKNVKTWAVLAGIVKKLTCAGVTLWQDAPKNWVKYSTEADGVTIYNGGLGYKDGYRVRSGGAEAAQSDACASGYIPFVKGEKLYIQPKFIGKNTTNAINFFTSSCECLGQITDSGSFYGFCTSAFKTKVVDGVSVLDISDVTVSRINEVAYVRVTNVIAGTDAVMTSGAEMIITKNEKITA